MIATRILKTFLQSAALFLTLLPAAHAQTGAPANLDELLSLDIENLANVEVSTASRKAEKISEAPGVITVITRNEIDKFGGNNLLDIFNRVPSMQILGSSFAPTNAVSMRAQTNQHYTNRILFLINGRPFRDGQTGGWNMGLFTQFSLNNIERIEVIRGPGSVLYGTNAFSGVVNIITRKAEAGPAAEAAYTYGSFNHRQSNGRASYGGEDWSVVAAVNKLDLGGDRVSMVDETGTPGSYRLGEDAYGLSVLGNYKNLTLQSFTTRTKEDSLGAVPVYPAETLEVARSFFDMGYTQELTENWDSQFNLTYNRLKYFTQEEKLFLAEASARGEITDNLGLLVGGSTENQKGNLLAADYDTQWYSFYTQLDWEPLPWLKATGGLQLNQIEGQRRDISPQASLIFTPYEHWGLKLLYGEAFRAATAVETFFVFPGVVRSDPNNRPETISTFETQLFYQDDALDISLTGYRSRIQDIIGRIPDPLGGPGLLITNIGEQVFEGIEFEGKTQLGGGWSLQGSASIQQAESDTNLDNPTFSPNWMTKIGAMYETDLWSFGAFSTYYGAPEDVRQTAPGVAEVNPQPDSYNLISANLNINISEWLGPAVKPGITFTIYGENLLDEKVYFPEYNRKEVNSFPSETGRALYGRLTARF